MIKIEVYGCEFCSMVSRRKGSVSRHEKHHCKKNESRKTCRTCGYLYFEKGSGEVIKFNEPYEADEWICTKKFESLDSSSLNTNIYCDFYSKKED